MNTLDIHIDQVEEDVKRALASFTKLMQKGFHVSHTEMPAFVVAGYIGPDFDPGKTFQKMKSLNLIKDTSSPLIALTEKGELLTREISQNDAKIIFDDYTKRTSRGGYTDGQ